MSPAGKLWSLQVYVATPENARKMRHGAKPGAWVVSLSLLESSQPTWVDAGFIVCKKDGTPTQAESPDPNWLRLKSTHQLAAPPRPSTISASFKEAFSLECLSAYVHLFCAASALELMTSRQGQPIR